MKKGMITGKVGIMVFVVLAAIWFNGMASAACVQPPSGIVSWWSGDNNALDIVGTNHGTVNGATYAPGMVGQAFSFDGVDDYVDLPDGFANFTSGFTVGLWANPTASGYWARFIDLGNGQANDNILFERRSTSNDLALEVYDGAGNSTGMAYAVDAITNNEWHYYAATLDATGQVKLYKDGLPLVMELDTTGVPNNITRVNNYIGKSNWSSDAYYAGKIDEVDIFNRALDATEIAAIYDAGNAGKCKPTCVQPPSGMVSWWGGDNNALDMVGTNNGTVTGATYAAGIVGQAFSFDGTDDYVSISDADFRSDAARTMAFWVQTTDAGDPIVFGDNGPLKGAFFGRGNHTTQHLHLGIASGKPTVEWYESGHHSIQGTSNIADGNWHYLVFVSDGAGTVSLYADGVLEKAGDFVHTSTSSSTRFGSQYEGNDGLYSYYYNGLIDEVDFFSRALDASEIAATYNAGSAGKCRSCTLLPSGTVSWWKGEHSPNDATGANNGTLMGGATFAPGIVGQAFSFDGVDDYVDAGANDVFNFNNGTENFTIDAWIRLNAYPSEAAGIVGKATQGPFSGWSLYVTSDGKLAFTGVGVWGFTTAAGLVAAGNWAYVAVTRNGNDYKLYVNGAESASISHGDALETSTAPLRIGTVYVDSFFFNGLIDEVEILDRALSAGEIAAIYNAAGSGKCATFYDVTFTAPGGHGSLTCPASALQSYPAVCTIAPEIGYYLSALTDNGGNVLGSVSESLTYTISGVTEGHTLEATFSEYMIKRVSTSDHYYNLLTEAFDGASAGDVNDILLRRGTFTGSPGFDFNRPGVSINLKGGHPSGFGSNAGQHSTISDQLTISGGTVTVENVTIQ